MTNRLQWLLLSILLFLTLVSFAGKNRPFLLYVYGQPFEGTVVVSGHEIYAEAVPLAEALNFAAGYVFPKNIQRSFSGKAYVSLAGVAQLHQAMLSINWSTRIADLFVAPRSQTTEGPTIVEIPAPQGKAFSPLRPSNMSYGSDFSYYGYPLYTYRVCSVPAATPIWLTLPPHVHWNGAFFQDDQGNLVPMTPAGVPIIK